MRPASGLCDGSNEELFAGGPVPHFNEVDECAGDRRDDDQSSAGRRSGFDPSTTLHDVRWGEHYKGRRIIDAFVWLLQISGAAPANHFVGGYAGATSERQPACISRLGGGSLKGIWQAGRDCLEPRVCWGGALQVDLGRGTAIELPAEETERRWRQVTYEWPIMHVILHGVTQNQFMARHPANHVNIAYAPTSGDADRALAVKATMFKKLGLDVHICGAPSLSNGIHDSPSAEDTHGVFPNENL